MHRKQFERKQHKMITVISSGRTKSGGVNLSVNLYLGDETKAQQCLLLCREDLSLDPNTLVRQFTNAHNSSSKVSNALFWSPWVPAHTGVHTLI